MNRWSGASGPSAARADALKSILDCARNPEELDTHPWTHCLLVDDVLRQQPELRQLSPGRRLLFVLATLFADMMPSVPPRQGLRLDTQWGEFGLLAARYFAPIKYDAILPASLRDAWGRIDQAILLFVYGHSDGSLSPSEVVRYRLVGDEPQVAADSTLSDWHRKGLERLARLLSERERRLQDASRNDKSNARVRATRKIILGTIIGLAVLGVAVGGLKAYRLYVAAERVRADLRTLQGALQSLPSTEVIIQVSGQLPQLDRDLATLQAESQSVLWLSPLLTWVPNYGGDIAQAGPLMDFAHHLVLSTEKASMAATPLVSARSAEHGNLSLSDIAGMLTTARPLLLESHAELRDAQGLRSQIDVARLSPALRELVIDRIDPGVDLMDKGLTLGTALPSLLGAGSNGPQTYLLLAQNEDELRATGGFITAVGKLVLDRGRVVDLSFENSGDVDNWSMPYPMAPWPLSQYMNSPVLILRDANWFPDFPTTSLYVKQLYAYHQQNSVDGVIAFDQQMLILLLRTLGPVQVDGVSYPVTADNVQAYMRAAKTLPAGQPVPSGWTYKAFVGALAKAVLGKLLGISTSQWLPLSSTLMQALEERHLILQLDDPDAAAVFAKNDWNGALDSEGGDFLTVLDSNIGFNKTNAIVETNLVYDVDLSDLNAPRSELLVSHANHASTGVRCNQWDDAGYLADDYSYPIDRCFWDYMRVYVPQGTRLLGATPQAIPDAWMILSQHVTPRVDTLDEEVKGLSSFGTLLVVPGGGTQNVSMTFGLPEALVLRRNADGSWQYSLEVRKQPGTAAVPITVRVHLPAGATMQSPSSNWILEGQNVLVNADLRVDLHLEIAFRLGQK